jgi:uncharacterized GH25 family protein
LGGHVWSLVLRGRESKKGLKVSYVPYLAMAITFLIIQSTPALAHNFLIEQTGEDFTEIEMVVFGHGTQCEEFEVSKVKQVRALDLQGKEIRVQREKKRKGLMLKISGRPWIVMVSIDNGYWSKTIDGWKELPATAGPSRGPSAKGVPRHLSQKGFSLV